MEKKINPEEVELDKIVENGMGKIGDKYGSLMQTLDNIYSSEKSKDSKKSSSASKSVGSLDSSKLLDIHKSGNVEKYRQMIQKGVPLPAVEQKIRMENSANADQIISQLSLVAKSQHENTVEKVKNKVLMIEDVENLLREQIGRVVDEQLIKDLIESLVCN